MPKTYKMKDKTDKNTIVKNDIFNLPIRGLIIGASGSGKSSILGNLLMLPDFYKNDFTDYYIFSGSLHGDAKLKTMIDYLEIPKENLFDSFNEDIGHVLYDMCVEDFNDAMENKQKARHKIFIFDDLGFTNTMNKNKKNSILDKIYSNGRKYCISILCLCQRVSQINTNARQQANAIILFKQNKRSLEILEQDFNYLNSKKDFINMVNSQTKDNHDFMVIDTNCKDIYKNKEFKKICMCKGESKCGGVK